MKEVRGCKGKDEDVLEEGRGPRVPRSKGSKVQGSQEQRYLKLTFKYELDSKEGPSCSQIIFIIFGFHHGTSNCSKSESLSATEIVQPILKTSETGSLQLKSSK